MKKPNLILFTLTFPFGRSEAFIEEEIKIASQYYENIYIIPDSRNGGERKVPSNVTLLPEVKIKNQTQSYLIRKFISIYLRDLFYEKQRLKKIKALPTYYTEFRNQYARYLKIRETLAGLDGDAGDYIFYDFWMINNGLALSLMNEIHRIMVYANAHSYDLYDERWGCPLPFRSTIIRSLVKVFPDSAYGVDYLKSKISTKLHEKIELSYMGTVDAGASIPPSKEKITIVSCSTCAPHKRVDWIVEALSLIDDLAVDWVHFGDGPLFEQVKALANKKLRNTSVTFKGMVPTEELYHYFSTNPIHAFVHASNAEGVPVSLMIAASFGIPVVAYDAMGVGELVNNEHGRLLSKGASISDFSEAIKDMVLGQACSMEFRKASRDHWNANFSLDNYHILHRDKISGTAAMLRKEEVR